MTEDKKGIVKVVITNPKFLWGIIFTSLALHGMGIRALDQISRNKEDIAKLKGENLSTAILIMQKDIAQINDKLGRIETWQDRLTDRMFPQ